MSSLASGVINAGGQFLGIANASGLLTELRGEVGRVQFVRPGIGCVLQFDAALNEAHSRSSEPTNNPVEDGSVISDHIVVTPIELSLTGIVSDVPIYAGSNDITGKSDATKLVTTTAGSAIASVISPLGVVTAATAYAAYTSQQKTTRRSLLAYQALTKLQAGDNNATPATLPVPFTVLTRYARYTNMVIKALSFPRDASTSNVCVFNVTLTQINVVSPQTVSLKVLQNKALGSDKGSAGEQESEESQAYKAYKEHEASTHTKVVDSGSSVINSIKSVIPFGG